MTRLVGMGKTKLGKKGKALCPLCSKSMSRSIIGKHLRNVHKGIEGVESLCPWPDCGQEMNSQKGMRTHLYAHTDDKATPCSHFKMTSNGEWLRCRNTMKLSDLGQTWHHRRHVHGYKKEVNDSIDPWMADPKEAFDRATALGGNIKPRKVDGSQRANSTSGVAKQQEAVEVERPRQVPSISVKVDMHKLHTKTVEDLLEGLIPIKTEDIDDAELLLYL